MSRQAGMLLRGAAAVALLGAGTAHAAGTAAGTVVSNTFTLDYEVGGVAQTQITPAAGSETTFSVDRTVDVAVTASPTTQDVSPGQTGVVQTFTVTNEGNGVQAYDLDFVNGVDTTDDEFDMTTTAVTYTVYTPDGLGGFTSASMTYTPGAGIVPSADVAPDGYIVVQVTTSIPAGQGDGDTSDLVLVANTLEPAAGGIGLTAGAETTNSADPNEDGSTADAVANGEDTVQTVFADPLGTTGISTVPDSTSVADGAASAVTTATVRSALLTATKTVALVDSAPASDDACRTTAVPGTAVAGDYFVPGACVEYTILVENNGSQPATAVDLADRLAQQLRFVSLNSDLGGTTTLDGTALANNTLSVTACDGSTNCAVLVDGGTIPAASGGTATERSLVIRARVK